jgi:hypothetical protein
MKEADRRHAVLAKEAEGVIAEPSVEFVHLAFGCRVDAQFVKADLRRRRNGPGAQRFAGGQECRGGDRNESGSAAEECVSWRGSRGGKRSHVSNL